MPWQTTDPVKERTKFILEWETRWQQHEGQVNVAELCRAFGISRQAGYGWIRRYQEAGADLQALARRSRRPHTSPAAIPPDVQDVVVALRKQHPRWGPRKLRAWLVTRYPRVPMPGPRAIGAILRRRGLVTPRRRRRGHAVPITAPFAACDHPNAVWCVDFKGWFRTRDGEKCYPLTLIDAYSRYLLRCEVLAEPNGREVEYVFDSAFREFGLPAAIRSDNGPPFASTGAGGLTPLNVWWLRLGLRVERIEPGKPAQNGRQERFHRTLKLEVKPASSLRMQQRAFDVFRREYNQERPHEALHQATPASVYQPSRQHYLRPLETPHSPFPSADTCRAEKGGFIRWHRRRIFLSAALTGEYVALSPADDGRWHVYFGPILLGSLDEAHLQRGLIRPPRRKRRGALSTMSLVNSRSS
jgi:transposase InsO family protein